MHGVDASALGVETRAECVSLLFLWRGGRGRTGGRSSTIGRNSGNAAVTRHEATALVLRLALGVDVAIQPDDLGARVLLYHVLGYTASLAAARVQRRLVLLVQVDVLDDVDLAVGRPVWADHPESGPDAADASGHVGDVGDDEGACVVGFLGRDSRGRPAGGGCRGVVDGGRVVDS